MKTRFPFKPVAMMLFLLSSLSAGPAGIRPGPPPDPLGAPPAVAVEVERAAEARKPGPPPDPLKAEHHA